MTTKNSPRSSKTAERDRQQQNRTFSPKQPSYVPSVGREKRVEPPKRIKP